tara:strand:- start:1566 stop:2960 length:1395 start_codon:yes stop_codon:yes gene_type:complete
MTKKSIDIGSAANDGTGSNLRVGGGIVNDNFNEIYTAIGDGSTIDLNRLRLLAGGTGIDTTLVGNTVTFDIDSTVLTETSTDTLTNKSIDLATNTITGTTALFNTALSDDNFATIAGTETLTSKTLTSPVINTPTGDVVTLTGAQTLTDKILTSPEINTPTGDVVTKSGTQTLTNKTLTSPHITTPSGDVVSLSGFQTITNKTLTTPIITGSLFNIADDTSTTSSIEQGDVLKITGGTGISSVVSGDTITLTASGITNSELSGTAGITNANLANNSVTIGSTAISLGTTASTINGLSLIGSAYITVSGQNSAIRFNHANLAAFPSYTTYSGSPALAEDTLKPYVATSSGWVEMLTENSSADDISNISMVGITDGQVLAWSSSTTKFVPTAAASATPFTTDKTNVGDGSTTGFTILASRTVDNILVYVNGICLVPTDDYTISSTTLTFITAPAASAEIVFRYLGS